MDNMALDRNWSAASLLRFAFPSVAMMLFMGLYTVVDTIFVAQFVHADAFSSMNIVCPVIHLTVGLGTMLATGGNAIVSRKLGSGEQQAAREDFTLLIITGAGIGFLILFCGILWMDALIDALGASARLFPYCKDYLLVLLLFAPATILQTLFSNLFATAGKPGLGFGLSALAGIANVFLDYILIVSFRLGICGAALGTGFGTLIPAVTGLVYFARSKETLIFTRPKWRWSVIKESCFNGSSEMVGQLAAAVTTFLFNRTMMNLLGEDGVAAITILIYAQFFLNTLFIGFSIGVAPVIGFSCGSRNDAQQKNVVKICLGFIAAASALVFAISFFGGPSIVRLFADPSSEVYRIAAEGFAVFSFSFLFCGLNLFASALFTALSNGRVSAMLSFLRTFGLLSGGILFLPRFWGICGVWLAIPLAEGIMFVISVLCVLFGTRQRSGAL